MMVDEREPVWQLLRDAAQILALPFTVGDILDWFSEHHPDVPAATIRAQVSALTGNNQTYLVHRTYSKRPPVLWRVGWGQFEPYDLGRHGEPSVGAKLDSGSASADPSDGGQLPVWRLLEIASRELVAPFSVQEMIDWFADHYPDIPSSTVRSQMPVLAGNSPAFRLHPTYSNRPPVLMRVERGVYEPYDESHQADIVGSGAETSTPESDDPMDDVQEFVLEQYLEEFLVSNWARIDFGRRLTMWSPDARSARQFDASPIGRIDFLCLDPDSDALVVVELKRGKSSDAVVGQTLRYIGWVARELARPGQPVEGLIVVGEPDQRLLYAAAAVPTVAVMQYRIDFRFEAATLRG